MILITGSKGDIGSHLMGYLKKDYIVRGYTEDIRNIEALRPHFKGVDMVIHCAAKKYDVSDEEFYSVNVEGTRNVAQLCLENNAKLIHLSSISINGAYGDSKQKGQEVVEQMMEKGLKAVILRLCSIGDPHPHRKRYPMEELMRDIRFTIDNFKIKIIDYERGYPVSSDSELLRSKSREDG
jgi:nucleoside-diphosphate-sugar epimerase